MVRSGQASLERAPLPGGAILTTVTGTQPGPTLALLGGVHGDEDEGVLAVLRVVHEVAGSTLAGQLRAVAPANPAAWAARSRVGPLDGDNLARSFPGGLGDGHTSALAAGITGQVIEDADLLIDLHSAGVDYRMPLFCGFVADGDVGERSRQAAVEFGAPLVWSHPHSVPGRSLSVAHERGIPAIYAECSGGGSIRGHELDAYVAGVLLVMAHLGMVPPPQRRAAAENVRYVFGSGDLDKGAQANHHGFFVSTASAGADVVEGTEIGRLYSYDGRLMELIRAPREGVVMFLRRQARTRAGDVLFLLARLDEGRG